MPWKIDIGKPPDKPKATEVEFSMKEDYVKKSRFTNSRIMAALKRVEGGLPAPEICRELCISTAIAL
jgi:hypothetical protein